MALVSLVFLRAAANKIKNNKVYTLVAIPIYVYILLHIIPIIYRLITYIFDMLILGWVTTMALAQVSRHSCPDDNIRSTTLKKKDDVTNILIIWILYAIVVGIRYTYWILNWIPLVGTLISVAEISILSILISMTSIGKLGILMLRSKTPRFISSVLDRLYVINPSSAIPYFVTISKSDYVKWVIDIEDKIDADEYREYFWNDILQKGDICKIVHNIRDHIKGAFKW